MDRVLERYRVLRLALITVTMIAVMLSVVVTAGGSGSWSDAYNGYLEDCDFDGKDDETGAPVPWYGFDETRGDVVPTDWDGVAGSYAFDRGAGGDSGYTPAKKATSSQTSGASASSASSADAASSAASSTGTSSSAAQSASQTGTKTIAGTNEYLSAKTQELLDDSITADAIAIVTAVKGKLSIVPQKADGSDTKLHSGDTIVIKGQAFSSDVTGYVAELHSDPVFLTQISTSSDGSFEVSVVIPEGIEPGIHNIWILYQGNPVVQKSIEIAPQVAYGDAAGEDHKAVTKDAGSGGDVILFASLSVVLVVAVVSIIAYNVLKKRKLAVTSQDTES